VSDGERCLRQFLDTLIATYRRIGQPAGAAYHARLLAEGAVLVGRSPRSAWDGPVRRWVRRRKPQAKQCYQNASRLALDGLGDYHEGYCWAGLLPAEHAWLVRDGRVVDVTLDAADRLPAAEGIKPRLPLAEYVYLGCPVPLPDLLRVHLATRYWEPVLPHLWDGLAGDTKDQGGDR
jgi:hypothetical protein